MPTNYTLVLYPSKCHYLLTFGTSIISGTEIIDTNNLASALMGGTPVQHSLRNILSSLDIKDVQKLHNGGNDARYTLVALLRMSGLTVDEL